MSEESQKSEEEKKNEELQKVHEALKKVLEQADLCMVQDRIVAYLKMLGLKFEWSNEANAFLVPYKINNHKHIITIRTVGNWLIISVGILAYDEVPPGKKADLYKTLLLANHEFPEFSFDIDQTGNIGYSEDIFIPALTFDVFAEEFLSVPVAIKYFWEKIYPQLGGGEPRKTDFVYT
ncbi:MAG: hypothetical protein ACP6IP_01550 [Candidatus Njordarchaeia archaeon]